jgi:hypothetical protein
MPERPNTIGFLPWLTVAGDITLGQFQFIPFKVPDGSINPQLKEIEAVLNEIISSYVDLQLRVVRNFTVVVRPGKERSWDVANENVETIQRAVSLLCLCAMAKNDYFQQVLPKYANATNFQPYFQSFTQPIEHISLRARRRDGGTLIAGHKHGEVKFVVPLQCESLRETHVDSQLVDGLNLANVGGSALTRRLIPAMSFFGLANTDADGMLSEAEVVLMGSAFEQLLEAESAIDLSRKLGDIFQDYGSVLVRDAIDSRRGILIDPDYADAQLEWFVHRKWIQELHQLRSYYVHGEDYLSREWGWSPKEHLAIGAFLFPLVVKLFLQSEGFYELNECDELRYIAIDRLLVANDWGSSQDNPNAGTWQQVLSDCKSILRRRKAKEAWARLRMARER